jgi:energy-coupling factor transport system permease protein
MLIVVSLVALFFSTLSALVLLFLFELALACTCRAGKQLLRALTLTAPLLVLVVVLDSFFSKVSEGPVFFSAQIGFIHPEVTAGGILVAVAMGFRLLALAGISFLVIRTTSPDDVVQSLKGMHVPPILVFSLGYAIRSIADLAGDTKEIMDAQRSRGLELDRGSALKNRDKLAALFIPVTVSMIRRSRNTSDAMQARGFRQSESHSCLKNSGFSSRDYRMLLALAALFAGLWSTRYLFPV